jgi:hypothetical protein
MVLSTDRLAGVYKAFSPWFLAVHLLIFPGYFFFHPHGLLPPRGSPQWVMPIHHICLWDIPGGSQDVTGGNNINLGEVLWLSCFCTGTCGPKPYNVDRTGSPLAPLSLGLDWLPGSLPWPWIWFPIPSFLPWYWPFPTHLPTTWNEWRLRSR